MMSSTARLLQLLSLLQIRREWTGAALAERMGVTDRTVRRDIDKLRELGYPIRATAGVAGGYQLGPGAQLPPLLLDNDEALAVALGLAAVAASPVAGVAEGSVRALTKLEQVLPARLRSRFTSLKAAVTRLGGATDAVDPSYLTEISGAIASRRQLAFEYERADEQRIRRLVEPYQLVDAGQRWYLVAWDTVRTDWRTFRVDRIRTRPSERARYTPRPLPAADAAAYVQEAITRSPYRYDVTVRLRGGPAALAGRVAPTAGQLEVDPDPPDGAAGGWSILRAGWDDVEGFLGYLLGLETEFHILGPPEFLDRCRAIIGRLEGAVGTRSDVDR
ncbi:WYL domain-containing protein [Occultella glacieicola]|uniref:WYL domain-containing protein n=1 Tax=Occultella glacieicola TaxID=2518684 RepID=A0ABY2E949_9MICO|nr:WYL domain-containing protein [Occultella glacieicola]TDE95805.1 WYL domain-containing protein [Occultella glacieicola]